MVLKQSACNHKFCSCVFGNFCDLINLIKDSLLTDATELALRSHTLGNKFRVSHAKREGFMLLLAVINHHASLAPHPGYLGLRVPRAHL